MNKLINVYEENIDRLSKERKLKDDLAIIYDKLGLRSYGAYNHTDNIELLVEVLVRKGILKVEDFEVLRT